MRRITTGLAVIITASAALILSTTGNAQAADSRSSASSPRPSSSTIAAVRPLSASGCTGSEVCIDVNGTGLHVNYIDGTVYNFHASQWCGYIGVTVYKNGTYYTADQSPYLCLNGEVDGVTYYTDWKDSVNQNYPSGSKACTWAYTSSGTSPGGPPCETIG